jgi:hypothetical protein
MNENLILNAGLYASRHELELAERLGSGKDGIVLVAKGKAKPANLAIKVLWLNEPYFREKQVYERLKSLGVEDVAGFNVPQLVGFEDDLRVIAMTIVKRPFVLDFAGAHLDQRPEFPEEVWADWEADKREKFEERWPAVQAALNAFEELGIYLLDVSPSNIAFRAVAE